MREWKYRKKMNLQSQCPCVESRLGGELEYRRANNHSSAYMHVVPLRGRLPDTPIPRYHCGTCNVATVTQMQARHGVKILSDKAPNWGSESLR